MNTTTARIPRALAITAIALIALTASRANAVEAVLLQDTYVDTVNPTTNFGANALLRVENKTSPARNCSSFVQFSLSTLPSGTTASNVNRAILRMWVNSSTTAFGAMTLTPITSTWNESTITNSNSSGMTYGSPVISNISVSSASNFIAIDVTSIVQAWLNGTATNNGIKISVTDNTATVDLYLDTKESTTTSHEPQLEVILNGPAGPQGPAGATGATGPVGLNWKGNWSSSTAYAVNDAVFSGGSAYIALAANTNVQPPASGTWSLVSQKGDTGLTGPQGAQGAQGTTGVNGAQGPAGATGATGTQGPAGPTGATGAVGAQGSAGPTGPQGPAGLNWKGNWSNSTAYAINDAVFSSGSAYVALQSNTNVQPPSAGQWDLLVQKGDSGPAGAQGATGAAGTQGPVGAQGPQGSAGDPGPAGPQGPVGAAGAAGTQGPVGAIGPQGPAGLTWKSDWSGSTAYSVNDAVMSSGSAYVALQTNTNVQPPASGTWSLLAQKGDIGAAGAQGLAGPAGAQGPAGPQGPAGDTGVAGPAGPGGADGAQGPAGPQGAAGPQGPAGTAPTHIEPMGDLSMGDFTQGPTP
jgi:Collagen triple helix repeat (20 copies)